MSTPSMVNVEIPNDAGTVAPALSGDTETTSLTVWVAVSVASPVWPLVIELMMKEPFFSVESGKLSCAPGRPLACPMKPVLVPRVPILNAPAALGVNGGGGGVGGVGGGGV